MPTFARRYSDKQRAALYTACITEQEPVKTFLRTCREQGCEGLTREEATELGRMPYAYATRVVADERIKRQALVISAAEPEPAIRELLTKQLVMAQEETEKLYRHPASKLRDHGALAALAKLTRELTALSAQVRGPSKTDTPSEEKQPPSFAAQIAAATRETDQDEDPSGAGPDSTADSGDNGAVSAAAQRDSDEASSEDDSKTRPAFARSSAQTAA